MPTRLTVTSTEAVTPVLRRVWFRSEDLSAFAESRWTDRYVKLVFPRPGVTYPAPLDSLDLKTLRRTFPGQDLPVVRTYTAMFPEVSPDTGAGTVAIDFVTHGDEGVAGPWARDAQPGDTLVVNGPNGAYRPDPDAAWHLLVGDESAVPAITSALMDLPADAQVRALVLVDDADHELRLPLPPGGEVIFLHRSSGQDLSDAVRGLTWLPGLVHAFVHGEAQEVMHTIRPHLVNERGLTREQLSISGYWRRGRTEEGFREWKSELVRAEGSSAGPAPVG